MAGRADILPGDGGAMLTLRSGRSEDDARAVAPLEDDDLREPWGDVPAIPAGADWRRSDLVPAGALRAYRRWLACEDLKRA